MWLGWQPRPADTRVVLVLMLCSTPPLPPPQDDSIPDFKDVIRFEPRELTKYFEVRWRLVGGQNGRWPGR